jgi:hypothetical protein
VHLTRLLRKEHDSDRSEGDKRKSPPTTQNSPRTLSAFLLLSTLATPTATAVTRRPSPPPVFDTAYFNRFEGIDGTGARSGVMVDHPGSFYATVFEAQLAPGAVFTMTPRKSGYCEEAPHSSPAVPMVIIRKDWWPTRMMFCTAARSTAAAMNGLP